MIAPRRTAIALLVVTFLSLGAAGCGIKAKDTGISTDDTTPVTLPTTTVATSEPGNDTTTEPDDTTTEPDETTTEPDKPTTTSGGSGDMSPKVAEYCGAVEDYVAKVKAAMSDPTGALAGDLVAEGQKLSQKASELSSAGLSPAEIQAVSKCTQEATSALTGG